MTPQPPAPAARPHGDAAGAGSGQTPGQVIAACALQFPLQMLPVLISCPELWGGAVQQLQALPRGACASAVGGFGTPKDAEGAATRALAQAAAGLPSSA